MDVHGRPCTPWTSIEVHGRPWNKIPWTGSMEINKIRSIAVHGQLWKLFYLFFFHNCPWTVMEIILFIPMNVHGIKFHRNFFYYFPWTFMQSFSIAVHGQLWNLFYYFPWPFMESFSIAVHGQLWKY